MSCTGLLATGNSGCSSRKDDAEPVTQRILQLEAQRIGVIGVPQTSAQTQSSGKALRQ